jgi:hypothetical protein
MPPDTQRTLPPGEGERRALRGCLPQPQGCGGADRGGVERGTLHAIAIAVADPAAGRVDGLQLLTGNVDALPVDAFQVKWSGQAGPLADAELRRLVADAVDDASSRQERSRGPASARRSARGGGCANAWGSRTAVGARQAQPGSHANARQRLAK